jgi:hypothetical protein
MTSAGYALRLPSYSIINTFGTSLLRDAPNEERKTRLAFHIDSGDYFGTLATILGLAADTFATGGRSNQERAIATLGELREDLEYAQDTYTIRRK